MSEALLSTGHQVTLHALEVLRLIGDRMEQRKPVDIDDVRFLFHYLDEVVHPYLNVSATSHLQVRTVFGELSGTLDSESEDFVRLSRVYTNLLADIILLDGVGDEHTHTAGDHHAHTGNNHDDGQAVHNLELKYISPHCI